MRKIVNAKKTILHLPVEEAIQWCVETQLALGNLWVREMNFRDHNSRYVAGVVQRMMKDGRRTADPHLKRMQELRSGECQLTHDLLDFVVNVRGMLQKERFSPFEQEMSQDDGRSWLAEKRKALSQKVKRERTYRVSVPYPDGNAATEEESKIQEEVALLLEELLKSFPPQKLPRRPKQEKKPE